jgi:hypothetical protein
LSTASSGHRRRVARGTPAAQQAASVQSIALGGVMTSISSSSSPSTHHIERCSASHRRSSRVFHQRHARHPWRKHPQCCQMRATRQRTSGRKSIVVVVGKTVTPPSSVTTRCVEISRVATLRKTLTGNTRRSPLTPQEFQGGCMALAPHLCMVVWPHKFRPYLPEKFM